MELLTQIAKASTYTPSYSGSSYSSSLSSSDYEEGLAAIIGGLGLGLIIFLIFILVLVLVSNIATIVGRWKLLKKAGKEGYIALIPVYSDITEMNIVGMPLILWFLNYTYILSIFGSFFSAIPLVGWIFSLGLSFLASAGVIIFNIWKSILLAKSFGKSTGIGVLLAFFPYVMYPILGFGNAEYQGQTYNSIKK